MARDTVLALPKVKLVSVHTRSSYMPRMPLELLVERSRVAVLARLEIMGELGVLTMKEERVVMRQPPHPQVPFEVDSILSLVVCSFYLQKKIVVQNQRYMI